MSLWSIHRFRWRSDGIQCKTMHKSCARAYVLTCSNLWCVCPSGAHEARGGVRGLIQRHHRDGPEAEERDPLRDGLLHRPGMSSPRSHTAACHTWSQRLLSWPFQDSRTLSLATRIVFVLSLVFDLSTIDIHQLDMFKRTIITQTQPTIITQRPSWYY